MIEQEHMNILGLFFWYTEAVKAAFRLTSMTYSWIQGDFYYQMAK